MTIRTELETALVASINTRRHELLLPLIRQVQKGEMVLSNDEQALVLSRFTNLVDELAERDQLLRDLDHAVVASEQTTKQAEALTERLKELTRR